MSSANTIYECGNIGCIFKSNDAERYKEHQKKCVYNTRNIEPLAPTLVMSEEIKKDNINPSYYHGRDVMDIINRYELSFCLATTLKYILRAQNKNGVEDLKKAKWYLEEEIRIYESGEGKV